MPDIHTLLTHGSLEDVRDAYVKMYHENYTKICNFLYKTKRDILNTTKGQDFSVLHTKDSFEIYTNFEDLDNDVYLMMNVDHEVEEKVVRGALKACLFHTYIPNHALYSNKEACMLAYGMEPEDVDHLETVYEIIVRNQHTLHTIPLKEYFSQLMHSKLHDTIAHFSPTYPIKWMYGKFSVRDCIHLLGALHLHESREHLKAKDVFALILENEKVIDDRLLYGIIQGELKLHSSPPNLTKYKEYFEYTFFCSLHNHRPIPLRAYFACSDIDWHFVYWKHPFLFDFDERNECMLTYIKENYSKLPNIAFHPFEKLASVQYKEDIYAHHVHNRNTMSSVPIVVTEKGVIHTFFSTINPSMAKKCAFLTQSKSVLETIFWYAKIFYPYLVHDAECIESIESSLIQNPEYLSYPIHLRSLVAYCKQCYIVLAYGGSLPSTLLHIEGEDTHRIISDDAQCIFLYSDLITNKDTLEYHPIHTLQHTIPHSTIPFSSWEQECIKAYVPSSPLISPPSNQPLQPFYVYDIERERILLSQYK